MTDASTGNVSSHRDRGGGYSVVLTAMFAAVRRLWHAVASLAEDLSDAGHGPARWRERSEVPNPYAGMGPIDPDEAPPEADT